MNFQRVWAMPDSDTFNIAPNGGAEGSISSEVVQ